MRYVGKRAEDVKIAYIGGGSQGWAWKLMADLALCDKISGTVLLYDINSDAAAKNEIIGNKFNDAEGSVSRWEYKACKSIKTALSGADFVIISILPGSFDEMESDVHTPEKYGIYQSVGDTSGPGGIIRALRTIPMYEEFAKAIEKYCPDAWVINYTNPMTICTETLYKVFPKIKAFGCCHEVFGTQKLLLSILEEELGIIEPDRSKIRTNVVGVNHFTWLTSAKYHNTDLFPLYRKFAEKYYKTGYTKGKDDNWMNNSFQCCEKVKIDLFRRFGYIAAAGDRHLAEFCPGSWYLKDPETVKEWGFGLTTVPWRKGALKERLEKSERLINGSEQVKAEPSGEEGVAQICALLGLGDLVTNVNIPNVGQIPNLPAGAVVETNAHFTSDSLTPLFAGNIPEPIYPMISRISGEQQLAVRAGLERNLNMAFEAFVTDPLVTCSLGDSKKLFNEMIENTSKYINY